MVEVDRLLKQWREVVRVIPSLDCRPRLLDALVVEELVLDRPQWTLLVALDGRRTVRDVVERVGHPVLEVCHSLLELVEAGAVGILDPEPPRVEPAPPAVVEIAPEPVAVPLPTQPLPAPVPPEPVPAPEPVPVPAPQPAAAPPVERVPEPEPAPPVERAPEPPAPEPAPAAEERPAFQPAPEPAAPAPEPARAEPEAPEPVPPAAEPAPAGATPGADRGTFLRMFSGLRDN